MWYRVELRKDGAVASCKEVEGLIPEKGGRVYYIEAESKEGAISVGLMRYNDYLARQRRQMAERREVRKAENRCRECGGGLEPERAGMQKCKVCAVRANALAKFKIEPGKQGVLSDRAKAARMPDVYVSALRVCLAQFDKTTPRAFRTWLVNEIERREPARVVAAE